MTSEPGAAVPSTHADGILSRIFGIIRHPRSTLSAVATSPSWIGMMVVLTLAAVGSRVALFETPVGRTALVDEWERTAQAFGQEVDDARYAELRRLSAQAPLYGAAAAMLGGPVLSLAVAAGVYLLFGTRTRLATFTQVCAIAVHASVPLALRQIVAAPVSYVSESTASATSVGAWFQSLNEASPLARFVGALDVFVIWWVVLLAIGVSVLYHRSTRGLAAGFLGAYAAVALLLAGVMAALGGTT